MMGLSGGPQQKRTYRLLVVAVLALFSVALSACGGDETGGPETGADVGDVAGNNAYFDDSDRYVGQKITVSARVTEVFTPTSFELNAGEWGDESLLVASARKHNNVRVGDLIQVTGTVKPAFTYGQNAQQYRLATDANVYDSYEGEKYLAATSIKQQVRSTQ